MFTYKVYADCVCGCGKRAALKSKEPIINPPEYHHARPWTLPGDESLPIVLIPSAKKGNAFVRAFKFMIGKGDK